MSDYCWIPVALNGEHNGLYMQLHRMSPWVACAVTYALEPGTATCAIAIRAQGNMGVLCTEYPEYENWVKENPKEKIRPFFEKTARNLTAVLQKCDLKLSDIWNASRTNVPKEYRKSVDETFTRLKEIYVRRPRLMYTL